MEQEIKKLPIAELRLWTENPRDPIASGSSDRDVILRAIADPKHNWNLDKMMRDLGDVYYLNTLPTVVVCDGEYVVYDGNRRIAVLKCLQDDELFQIATGRLNLDRDNPLASMTEIDCNVCDRNTALDIVAKAHAGSNVWGKLEFETFKHNECGEPAGRLMIFDRASGGLVSKCPRLNSVYVQRRLLSEGSLAPAGLAIADGRLLSSWPEEMDQEVLLAVRDVVENKLSNDRRNASDLRAALIELDEERFGEAPTFDPDQCHEVVPPSPSPEGYGNAGHKEASSRPGTSAQSSSSTSPADNLTDDMGKASQGNTKRRTSPTKRQLPDRLLGEPLQMSGAPNDHYWALDYVYEGYKRDPDKKRYLLPMMGFGLRLLFETLGAEYYSQHDDGVKRSSVLNPFLKDVVKPALRKQDQSLLSQLSVSASWLSNEKDLNTYLSKWAHGEFDPSEEDILCVAQVARMAALIVFPQ